MLNFAAIKRLNHLKLFRFLVWETTPAVRRAFGSSKKILLQGGNTATNDKSYFIGGTKVKGKQLREAWIGGILFIVFIALTTTPPAAEDIYSGDFDVLKQMHGHGTMKYINGDMYEGKYSNPITYVYCVSV